MGFSGIEHSSNPVMLFFETVEKRDAPIFLPLIQKWVTPDSVIHLTLVVW